MTCTCVYVRACAFFLGEFQRAWFSQSGVAVCSRGNHGLRCRGNNIEVAILKKICFCRWVAREKELAKDDLAKLN